MNSNGLSSVDGCTRHARSKNEKHALVAAGIEILAQAEELIGKADAEQYAKIVNPPFSASMGQHYRHVIEHFSCLVDGLTSGEVNYDGRKRDRRIEIEREYALFETRKLMGMMGEWNREALDTPCQVVSSVGYDLQAPEALRSNVARELSYCIGHAIHHYAIIRLICSHVGVAVPDTFGFAPSTLRHQETLVAE